MKRQKISPSLVSELKLMIMAMVTCNSCGGCGSWTDTLYSGFESQTVRKYCGSCHGAGVVYAPDPVVKYPTTNTRKTETKKVTPTKDPIDKPLDQKNKISMTGGIIGFLLVMGYMINISDDMLTSLILGAIAGGICAIYYKLILFLLGLAFFGYLLLG